MSWLDGGLFGELQNFLKLTSLRTGLVANNMANIDTPGFKTQDIDFQQELSRADQQGGSAPLQPFIHRVGGLEERADGNNVSMDRESMLMAQSQLQYAMGVTMLRDELKRIQMAITEGSTTP